MKAQSTNVWQFCNQIRHLFIIAKGFRGHDHASTDTYINILMKPVDFLTFLKQSVRYLLEVIAEWKSRVSCVTMASV